MTNDRPPIPKPLKRAVRQACGFGCVVCGLPLYHYDHLVDYSIVKEHTLDNLVLLCARHHQEKTNSLLPVDSVEAARRAPFNIRSGQSAPYGLHYAGTVCSTAMGTCVVWWSGLPAGSTVIPLLIDDTPIISFRFEDEQLLLTMQLFDAANRLLVKVIDNELVYSMANWDVTFVGSTLTVRSGHGKVFATLRFEPPSRVRVMQGRFWRNGVECRVTSKKLSVGGSEYEGLIVRSRRCIGIAAGDIPEFAMGLAGFVTGAMRSTGGIPAGGETETRTLRITPKS
jgi:HNH endonuclease